MKEGGISRKRELRWALRSIESGGQKNFDARCGEVEVKCGGR